MSDTPPPADARAAGPHLELQTPRLRLTAGSVALAPAVRDFSWRNHRHFGPWNPPTPEGSYTLEAQAARLQAGLDAFAAGTGWRWWLVPAGELAASSMSPPPVIGSIHFSQVMRGAFHSAVLGYALDEAYVGRGLMTEALRAGLAEVFSGRVNLHRVQAAYRPENERSAAVLRRLGFTVEGMAPRYLFIDGDWRDHQVTSLLNPDFRKPAGW